MAIRKEKRPTAAEAAEKSKPKWRAVKPLARDDAGSVGSDESSPELEAIRSKYPADASAPREKKRAGGTDAAGAPPSGDDELEFVAMEERESADTKVGRKTVLVGKDGRIVGEQG